jgi:hypothetical protein
LQRKTELNAHEAETHVPDLPETELWFLFHYCALGFGRNRISRQPVIVAI